MPIIGKMILNGADFAPLNLYGVGVFMAFSGKGAYRNIPACMAVPNVGPIPPGKYWIVERGRGGLLSWAKAKSQDLYNRVFNGAEFDRDEWFALYRDDLSIDDETWINDVKRGLFRLHPGRVSEGCITLHLNSDYALIRNALLRTAPIPVPCMKNLMARGYIEVVAGGYSNTCP